MTLSNFNESNVVDEYLCMVQAPLRHCVNVGIVPSRDDWELNGQIRRHVFNGFGVMGILGTRHLVELGRDRCAQSSVLLGELSRSTGSRMASDLTMDSDLSLSLIAHSGMHEQTRRDPKAASAGENMSVTEAHAGSVAAGVKSRLIPTHPRRMQVGVLP